MVNRVCMKLASESQSYLSLYMTLAILAENRCNKVTRGRFGFSFGRDFGRPISKLLD